LFSQPQLALAAVVEQDFAEPDVLAEALPAADAQVAGPASFE